MEFAIGALVGVFLSEVAFLVTSVYMHRALAHRAVRLSGPVTAVCRILVWMLTGICPREWVAVHRKHHAFSDRDGDPHSPVLLGYWRVQWANPVLYRRVATDNTAVARYARDLQPDRFDRLFFDRGWLGLVLTFGIIVAFAGWQVMVVAALVHGFVYLAGSGAINAIGHHWGRRPYHNLATNNRWLALLVAGEGLHNNHHAAPTSASFSFDRTQIDPGWLVISLLAHTRLATVRHREIRPRRPLGSPAPPDVGTTSAQSDALSEPAVVEPVGPLAASGSSPSTRASEDRLR